MALRHKPALTYKQLISLHVHWTTCIHAQIQTREATLKWFEFKLNLVKRHQVVPVLHRVRIVKLLTQHVVKGHFWVPTNGSPSCW